MKNINKNKALNELQELLNTNIQKKLEYLPDSFYIEEKKAIRFFNNRFFLESIIDKSISFNKALTWNYENKNLQLTTTAEELIDVFKLRSEVYNEIDYLKEFPDEIKGLNFDTYDANSAIIYYKNNKEVSGTIRLIFDSEDGLPSEKNIRFDDLRKKHENIGEISRNIVKYRGKGLNQEFKYLMCGIYNIFINNNINIALSGIKKDDLKLFKKLGGVEIYTQLNNYGLLKIPCLLISYNPSYASSFFKKVFLK